MVVVVVVVVRTGVKVLVRGWRCRVRAGGIQVVGGFTRTEGCGRRRSEGRRK